MEVSISLKPEVEEEIERSNTDDDNDVDAPDDVLNEENVGVETENVNVAEIMKRVVEDVHHVSPPTSPENMNIPTPP